MKTLNIEIPDVLPLNFEPHNSELVAWFSKLYEAIKPLTRYYLVGGVESAIMVWVRDSQSTSIPIEQNRNFGDDYDRNINSYNATEDSTEYGWWVFSVDLQHFDESFQPVCCQTINFFRKDFENQEIIQEKFKKIFEHLAANCTVPEFFVEKIEKALSVFST